MTIATETITIRLPVLAAQRLRRVAEIAHRPIDQVIVETLQSALPPLLDDLPVAFQPDLRQLESWSNEALRLQVFARLDANMMDRCDDLLEKNAADSLSDAERNELDALRHQADLLMFRKAYAALLLKWRGERVPTIAEMEAAA